MSSPRLTSVSALPERHIRERDIWAFLLPVGAIATGLILLSLIMLDFFDPVGTSYPPADLSSHVLLLLPYATAAGFLAALGLWLGREKQHAAHPNVTRELKSHRRIA